MNNITPQDLKALAEWVGYERLDIRDGEAWYSNPLGQAFLYSPLTNAEQSMEILKKLLDASFTFGKNRYGYVVCGGYDIYKEIIYIEDESLELAIVQAALAHIRGEK